jgi:hypothetical protein
MLVLKSTYLLALEAYNEMRQLKDKAMELNELNNQIIASLERTNQQLEETIQILLKNK